MCGICGWVRRSGGVDERPVVAMRDALAHRGPDGAGLWSDPGGRAMLGHRRLAVLDPDPRSDQPMVGPGGTVLVYNGEAYTFRALRRELEALGERFRTEGDTEVVLAALERWGAGALSRLDGMFALAWWDPREGRLLLARDRIGIKPLFWWADREQLVFASEVPALLRHPAVPRHLDPEGLARWLQLGYVAGEATLLRGVRRLPPGSLLVWDAGGVRVERWYDPLAAAGREPPPAPADLEAALRAAVSERLVADVPLGCFLSGGVDSTLVTAAAASTRPLAAVTVAFAGGGDESATAARNARRLGVAHHVDPYRAERMLAAMDAWPRVAGDPIADPSLAPTLAVCAAARSRWTVALSGDGGDELFGGYPRYRVARRLDRLPRRARVLASVVRALPARRWTAKLERALAAGDPWRAYQALSGLWSPREVEAMVGGGPVGLPWPEETLGRVRDLPPHLRWRALDLLTFLPERVLAKVDRASMAHSLEVRVPLLDRRVVEAALALPAGDATGKRALRRSLRRLAPGVRPVRRKRGFEVPLAAWLRGPLRPAVEREVRGGGLERLGLDPAPAERALAEHLAGRRDHAEPLFALWLLAAWAAEHDVAV